MLKRLTQHSAKHRSWAFWEGLQELDALRSLVGPLGQVVLSRVGQRQQLIIEKVRGRERQGRKSEKGNEGFGVCPNVRDETQCCLLLRTQCRSELRAQLLGVWRELGLQWPGWSYGPSLGLCLLAQIELDQCQSEEPVHRSQLWGSGRV